MSTNTRLHRDLQVDQLSYGAGICLWGVRVSALAAEGCRCVSNGFQAAFGSQGAQTRGAMRALLAGLVGASRRQIWMAFPASLELTCDEVCILNGLARAQQDDRVALLAHLRWLVGSDRVPAPLFDDFVRAGALLYSHGYEATLPPRVIPRASHTGSSRSHAVSLVATKGAAWKVLP